MPGCNVRILSNVGPSIRITIAALVILLTFNSSLFARDYTVNSELDENNIVDCISISGFCTLRAAIGAINNSSTDPTNTITLPEGNYSLTLPGNNHDPTTGITQGDLDITKNITIQAAAGLGPDDVIVTSEALIPLDRIFHTLGTSSVSFKNLTITGGSVSTGGSGIRHDSSGTLILDNVVVKLNQSTGTSNGGGIFLDSVTGTVTIQNGTVIRQNSATGGVGGGIYITAGTLNVDQSTIRDNSALQGGGIYQLAGGSYFGLTANLGSTINSNIASAGDGGGIYVAGGTTSLVNSTISGNSATGNGGGIYSTGTSQTLDHVTVTNNTATAGSGVYNNAGTLNLARSIIWGNSNSGTEIDCDNAGGTFASTGYNIFEGATCDASRHLDDLISTTDPKFMPAGLADNGGSTKTHALDPSPTKSPAINAIPTAFCSLGVDQRNTARDALGGGCDIGAFETSDSVDMAISISQNNATPDVGRQLIYTLTITKVVGGTSTAATGVTVTQTLPSGTNTSFVSATSSDFGCASPVAGELTCVANSAFNDGDPNRTIQVNLTATATGSVTSSAKVWSNEVDINLADNVTLPLVATIGPAPPSSGGCYIATAAYGTKMEKDVVTLRRFRDRYLLTNKPGKLFTELYYNLSPPIAAKISTSETLREWARASLVPLVSLGRLLDDANTKTE